MSVAVKAQSSSFSDCSYVNPVKSIPDALIFTKFNSLRFVSLFITYKLDIPRQFLRVKLVNVLFNFSMPSRLFNADALQQFKLSFCTGPACSSPSRDRNEYDII